CVYTVCLSLLLCCLTSLFFVLLGLQPVFLLHGKDLHLDVEKFVKLDKKTDFLWRFNYSNNIAKHVFNNDPVVFDNYEGRAELFGQNYSLLLKNVQHNDSGDYTAVTISGKEQRVAEYKVTVQDRVTPADLTVHLVSKSSDSCNLTVTCSTVDFNISSSFRCDAQHCSHADKNNLNTTGNVSSLKFYLHQDTIFCNHSNQVSWNQTMKVLKSYCDIKTASTSVLFFLTLSITLCVIMKCKFQCFLLLFILKLHKLYFAFKLNYTWCNSKHLLYVCSA
uniref:Immunoglobulin subtype domain-containing protein n=1 Tax=Astatotilapia calliptera TaxID=8154 RepID=A0A3P8NNS2_ASTCA